MNTVQAVGLLVARLLMALVFVAAGYSKIGGYAGTQEYMAAFGVPGALLPLVIALEIGAGVALALGLLTRLAALGLALFTLGAAVLFHANFADGMQQILFMKNLAMAGGLFALVASGAGRLSIDRRLGG